MILHRLRWTLVDLWASARTIRSIAGRLWGERWFHRLRWTLVDYLSGGLLRKIIGKN